MRIVRIICIALVLGSLARAQEYVLRELPPLPSLSGADPPYARGLYRDKHDDFMAVAVGAGGNLQTFILKGPRWKPIGPDNRVVVGRDMNDRGDIVGSSEQILPDGSRRTRPFVWSDGQFTELDQGMESISVATGVNNHRAIVGLYALADTLGYRGFLLRDGVWRDLGFA